MDFFLPKRLRSLAIFTAVYMIISGIQARNTGNQEFVFYLLVLIILAALIFLVDRRVCLPLALLWGLSVWGLLHMMGGMIVLPGESEVLYNYWLLPGFLRYDQLVHAYGFGLATWACWRCLGAIQPALKATPGTLLLVMLAGLGLGAVNETIEFFATLFLPDTNVGDYANTGWDLVFNLIGSLIAIVAIHSRHRGDLS
ncbi:DUF2238 domain-containing protein [Akkermansiaceae bacterium]|nr:DUF2238 domain-containing protein [Akkermansiaceae bacterium]MDB4544728.1 DUF2238 domain-containing protein [Akkermansiaceae bacterium]